MGIVDWDQLWELDMQSTGRTRLRDIKLWDGLAWKVDDGQLSGLNDAQLDLVGHGHRSIIEIGPGRGRLTIPLAKRCELLTAVEPSATMRSRLMTDCARQGINNIHLLAKRWEDIIVGEDLVPHELVLASYSMFMSDLSEQLKKMDEASLRSVYIFVPAEQRIPEDVQRAIYGRNVTTGLSEHTILFNALYELGIEANVQILHHKTMAFYESIDKATNDLAWFYNIPDERKTALYKHLEAVMIQKDGGFYLERTRKVGVVWWKK
ncbi:MAG: hypothetical protein HPY73_03200 [Methanomassiliicoccales archaeon]|nr:MAG: hypothetical protein HPY73_03160 [Methanomassiliicoccales archaeon]QLH74552.1 MAG: hypothetical protein HPY73_03200 [Methanomassiliicoccales archaeon]